MKQHLTAQQHLLRTLQSSSSSRRDSTMELQGVCVNACVNKHLPTGQAETATSQLQASTVLPVGAPGNTCRPFQQVLNSTTCSTATATYNKPLPLLTIHACAQNCRSAVQAHTIYRIWHTPGRLLRIQHIVHGCRPSSRPCHMTGHNSSRMLQVSTWQQ